MCIEVYYTVESSVHEGNISHLYRRCLGTDITNPSFVSIEGVRAIEIRDKDTAVYFCDIFTMDKEEFAAQW